MTDMFISKGAGKKTKQNTTVAYPVQLASWGGEFHSVKADGTKTEVKHVLGFKGGHSKIYNLVN